MTTPTRYKVPRVRVNRIYKKTHRNYISGVGPSALFEDVPIGWYLHLEGSFESICIGHDEPSLKPGDFVNIIIEEVPK